jgi:alpha-tubulin suppressor-like RCC1 family protein
MVISAECLVAQANACLSKELRMCEVAQLIGVNTNLNTVPYSVANSALLPDATCNTGRFVYVSDINDYRVSDGASWGRNFVSDVPVSNLLSWGFNGGGQLGDGSATVFEMTPVVPAGAYTQTWCNMSAGFLHTVAIKNDGTAWTWGCNAYGQLGNGVAGVGTDRCSPGNVCGLGTNWCQISAGGRHTAAVKANGEAWTWGFNTCGQLGDNTVVHKSSPVEVVHALGNTLWCQISAGRYHTAAVKTDGTAWTWGSNCNGRLGDNTAGAGTFKSSPVAPAGVNADWCQISAGGAHTVAMKTDCTAWTWGLGNVGQLGIGGGSGVARSSPVTPNPDAYNWCQISAGTFHTAAIKTDGTAWTWGCNSCGQLGIGVAGVGADRNLPVAVCGLGTTWCEISAGDAHTAAVKTDGTAWTWGANFCGMLGTDTIVCRCMPGVVSGGINTWCSISAGNLHTVGLIT